MHNTTCDETGKCSCKSGYTGAKCNECLKGYFKTSYGTCKGTLHGFSFKSYVHLKIHLTQNVIVTWMDPLTMLAMPRENALASRALLEGLSATSVLIIITSIFPIANVS